MIPLPGQTEDSNTKEPLEGASITMYVSGSVMGGICNKEGRFSINNPERLDSVRFSMIGYLSRIFKKADMLRDSFLLVKLEAQPSELRAVFVHPMDVMEIIRRTSRNIPSMIPPKDFESSVFFREIIRDSQQYYSVAEAIFKAQFFVQKKSFKLRLDKGRSKEDVAYTRLFEDFHPGGGPEDALGQSLVLRRPDFLNESSFKNYVYKKDSTIQRDDQVIYVISFDQKPGLKEALEKGKIYIDAEDFSILKFDAVNSPAGTPFIKSLKGTDKIFAEILHIDLIVKGWGRTASFTKIGKYLFLNYAEMKYDIDYKQPKKELNLNLMIHTELLITDFQHPLVHEINKEEEWKRKNLSVNLPTDFDPDFWGTNNILSPTSELKNIIDSLSVKNHDMRATSAPEGWLYLNREYFISHQIGDSIIIIPLARCSWEDNEAGGLLYKKISGDFDFEVKLSITKRNGLSMPENGFQQCGIMVRSESGKEENNIIFSMGTGGNDIPKYFLKRTVEGKSRSLVSKTNLLAGWLKLEKRGDRITAYKRIDESSGWTKVDGYQLDWLKGDLQTGFSLMAKFAGDGPRQKPDMRAVFSNVKITHL